MTKTYFIYSENFFVQVEQFNKQSDDLLFAKILIDWKQNYSIREIAIRDCRIDDFLICYLQFPDFSYSTENHELKDR